MNSLHQNLRIPEGAFPVPGELNLGNISNWLEYGIWGLVLYDNHAPWFALIECIQVLHSLSEDGEPLFPGPRKGPGGELQHEYVTYHVPLNRNLRHLLFKDTEVMRLREITKSDQSFYWDDLTRQTLMKTSGKVDLSYLRYAMDDFGKFANAIDLLKSAEVESFSAKRPTSRHLLPLGRDMLFADVDEDEKPDRLIFRRTGEILWLMLNRAKEETRARLTELVNERLLKVDNPWNNLARRIGGPSSGESTKGEPVNLSTGYLPMRQMDVYDHLAEDWIALLSLPRLQVEVLLDPMMRLSGLHQILYILRRCDQERTGSAFSPIVLDIAGSARKSPVQKLSADVYDNHRRLPLRAAESFIEGYASTREWDEIRERISRKEDAYEAVRRRFLWADPKRNPIVERLPEPRQYLDGIVNAYQKSSHTIWATMSNHGRRIGLVVARQGTGTWYSPNDSLLEALVLANVTAPVELGLFLRRLYRRYNIVIGPEHARAAFGDDAMSLEPFKANLVRLEERLAILGCIDRKSDACAFVINPYHS